MTNYCGTNGIKLPKLRRLLLVKSKADLGQHVRLLFKRKNGRLEATDGYKTAEHFLKGHADRQKGARKFPAPAASDLTPNRTFRVSYERARSPQVNSIAPLANRDRQG
jgi:hypothetical protein